MRKCDQIEGEAWRKKLYELRRRVNQLYFAGRHSKNEISRRFRVSKKFVIRWTQDREQEFSVDGRGWKMGKGRKWKEGDRQRIQQIHTSLREDPVQFYWGATAIQQEWRRRYPAIQAPPVRTIGQILSTLGLSQSRKNRRNKGAARYLCYPEYTIYELLGYRLLEADFIGCKYFSTCKQPLNFVGFSFKKTPRLRYFMRVSGETSNSFMSACEHFFTKFELPGAIKMDNCAATIGGNAAKRAISKTVVFLLQNRVIPIFSVPRKPFSQASIEGNNSVFSRKFWNATYFESVQEVETKLQWFNDASQRYTNYRRLPSVSTKKFIPKMLFIRQVKEGNSANGIVSVLNENISVPESYINYFVLAEWNLQNEDLMIYFEKDQKSELIQKIPFPVGYGKKPRSYRRYFQIKSLCEKEI